MQIKNRKEKFTKFIILSIILTFVFFLIGIYIGIRIFEFFYSEELLRKIEHLYVQAKALNEEIESNKGILLLDFLNNEAKCKLLKNTIEKVRNYSFNVIAKNMPYRLEEYEFYYKPSGEYLKLKNEYMKMMSTAYFLTVKYKKECDNSLLTLLYFYSSNCGIECINQGKELDKLRELDLENNVYFFIIDKDWELNEIKFLNENFNVTIVPTIIINEKYALTNFSNISLISFYLQKR